MVFATYMCIFCHIGLLFARSDFFFLNSAHIGSWKQKGKIQFKKKKTVEPRVSISINKPRVSILQQLRVSNSMGDSSASSVGVGEEGMARRRNRPVRVIRRIHGSIEELVVLCDCETVTVSPLRSSSRETSRGRRFYGCKNYRQVCEILLFLLSCFIFLFVFNGSIGWWWWWWNLSDLCVCVFREREIYAKEILSNLLLLINCEE